MEDENNLSPQAPSVKDKYRLLRLAELYESQFPAKQRKPKRRMASRFVPFTAKQSQDTIKPKTIVNSEAKHYET